MFRHRYTSGWVCVCTFVSGTSPTYRTRPPAAKNRDLWSNANDEKKVLNPRFVYCNIVITIKTSHTGNLPFIRIKMGPLEKKKDF